MRAQTGLALAASIAAIGPAYAQAEPRFDDTASAVSCAGEVMQPLTSYDYSLAVRQQAGKFTLHTVTNSPETDSAGQPCDGSATADSEIVLRSGAHRQSLLDLHGEERGIVGESTVSVKVAGTFSMRHLCEIARKHGHNSVSASVKVTQEYYKDDNESLHPDRSHTVTHKIGQVSCVKATSIVGGDAASPQE